MFGALTISPVTASAFIQTVQRNSLLSRFTKRFPRPNLDYLPSLGNPV